MNMHVIKNHVVKVVNLLKNCCGVTSTDTVHQLGCCKDIH